MRPPVTTRASAGRPAGRAPSVIRRTGPRLAFTVAVTAAVALGAAMPVHAQSLVDAWRAARGADPDLAVSRADRAAGVARAAQASTLWQPQVGLTASAGIGRSDTSVDGARFSAPGLGTVDGATFRTAVDGPSGRVAIAARQPLWSGERRAQSRQLELSGDLAESQALGAAQEAMLRTAERWLDVALASEALRVATRQQAAVDRALAEATDRWRMGDAPVTGTHEARARSEAVRAQVIGARTELELREVALADATGLPRAAAPARLPSVTPRAADVDPLARWLDEADAAHPAIRARTVALQVAREDAARYERSASASVDLVAQASRDRISGNGDAGSAASAATQALIGVQLSVPLWTGGAREARREEALRLADRAEAELARTRRQVAREVRAAWLALDAGAGRVAALEQALAASAARLGATRTGREVGDRTTLDLLLAENDMAQAELALAQGRVGLLVDRLRLGALAARLDESDLARVDAWFEAGR